jgi:hypothetical protein
MLIKTKSHISVFLMTALAVSLIPLYPTTAQGRPQSTILNVPFVMQAPFGEWSDDRQQYGCEEASIFMAMAWARGGIMPNEQTFKEEAKRDIINMSEYERVIYGFYQDTSAQDTARLVREFYQYQDVSVKENISIEDIKQELAQNRVVLLPLNTRLTGMAMYANGPVRHMIIAVGYDDKNDEIIVHDPLYSTADYLWIPSSGLQAALWNYNSGIHRPLGNRSTALISIGKNAIIAE